MLVSSPQVKKLKRWDNIFRRVIILAGVATIVCVLAILWSILKISIPLFKTNDIKKISAPTLANHSPLLYVTADEFLENVWGLSETGELVLQNLNKPELKKNIQITGGNTRRKIIRFKKRDGDFQNAPKDGKHANNGCNTCKNNHSAKNIIPPLQFFDLWRTY